MAPSPRVTESGILLVNKPEGLSSAALVARVKKMTGAQKAGHAGTLDPFADGLMVCGINKATRLSRFFLHGDKSYTATLTYGRETDTLDITGQEINSCDPDYFTGNPDFFSWDVQNQLIRAFHGPQEQLPPIFSALKHKGVPLYKLARKGTPVQKEARSIVIRDITLLSMEPPNVRFSVTCSSGTYIRTLASDIGKKAGCGAVLSALTRTGCCGFSLDQAVDLETLAQSDRPSDHLVSMDQAMADLVPIHVGEALANNIKNGMSLTDLDIPPHEGYVKILEGQHDLIAVLEWDKMGESYKYCCVFPD